MSKLLTRGFHRIRSRNLEGRIIVAGTFLLGFVMFELIILSFADRAAAAAMWRGLAIEMVIGREAGIPASLSGGAPRWLVAQVSATQDLGVVCLAFPAFLWAVAYFRNRKRGEGWLMRRLLRLQRKALAHEKFTRRWGPLGVFVFMLVPFLVNGPLLGAIAGRVAGIKAKDLILPIVAATVVAALAWTYAYDAVFDAVGGIDPRIPPLATAAIVCALLSWSVIGEWREGRAAKAD